MLSQSQKETVSQLVEKFELIPHPEGGFYREIYRASMEIQHPAMAAGVERTRNTCTKIYSLFPADDFSAFHRVRGSDELWHLYAGGPAELHVILADGTYHKKVITNDPHQMLAGVGEPCHVIPADAWQAVRCTPDCTAGYFLAGCTVAPGFDFADFDMPPATEIIAEHPHHEVIIRELTKS